MLSQFFTTLIFKVDYRRIGNVAPLGKAVSNYSLSHNGMDSQPHLLKILLDEKNKKKDSRIKYPFITWSEADALQSGCKFIFLFPQKIDKEDIVICMI